MMNTFSRDRSISPVIDEQYDVFQDARAADVYIVDGLETSPASPHLDRIEVHVPREALLLTDRQSYDQGGCKFFRCRNRTNATAMMRHPKLSALLDRVEGASE
jgi:hypothetical protein